MALIGPTCQILQFFSDSHVQSVNFVSLRLLQIQYVHESLYGETYLFDKNLCEGMANARVAPCDHRCRHFLGFSSRL